MAVPRSKHLVRPRLRAACKLLRLDALVALEWGDAGRAWRRAEQLRQLADGLSLRPGILALSDARLAEAMAADVTALLSQADALDEAVLGGREAVRGVITRLLVNGPTPRDVARQVRVERVVVIDSFKALAEGTARPGQLVSGDFVAAALEGMGLLRVQPHLVVDYHTRLIEMLEGAPSLDRSILVRRNADFHATFAGEGFAQFRLAQGIGPWYSGYAEEVFSRLASRRLAAASLAIRLYRNDHGDAFPKSLDDLVPAYLPAVPDDPTSAQSARMRYRGDGPAPIIWFSGANGEDDGGAEERPGMTYEERRATDRVARLKKRPDTGDRSQP